MTKHKEVLTNLDQSNKINIDLPEEFFNSIQDKMGGNLLYKYLHQQDKESFLLALKVILELTSYNVPEGE